MHKQNTTNEVDKIMRRQYVYYYQHETDFQGVTVEEADLLDWCALWLGSLFLTFRTNVLLSFSGLWVNSQTPNTRGKGVHSSKRRDEITQPHGATTQNTFFNSWFRASWFNVNKKVQLDATICRHLFTAKSLYMFRASQHPLSGALKTVTATSGIGHNTGIATSFQCGLLRTPVLL